MKKTFEWLCRLILGGTFVYAGAIKAIDPRAFAVDVGNFQLLPYSLTPVLGVYLPWLELTCGAAVLFRWRDRGALLLLLGLCVLFTVALTSVWFRGLDINCGCFGHNSTASALPIAFVRSLVLGLAALNLFMWSRQTEASAKVPGSIS